MPSTADDPVTVVHVWHSPLSSLRPAFDSVLHDADRARIATFRRGEDRARTTLGIVLAKLAIAFDLGVAAAGVELERVCARCAGAHGKPRASGIELSVAHSGGLVVAATSRHAAVGIDVETISRFEEPAGAAPGATRATAGAADRATTWCRKEAVVKATGDGLAAPLADVLVTPPTDPPALLSYPGLQVPVTLADLGLQAGCAAAVAVLAGAPVRIHVSAADALLAPRDFTETDPRARMPRGSGAGGSIITARRDPVRQP